MKTRCGGERRGCFGKRWGSCRLETTRDDAREVETYIKVMIEYSFPQLTLFAMLRPCYQDILISKKPRMSLPFPFYPQTDFQRVPSPSRTPPPKPGDCGQHPPVRNVRVILILCDSIGPTMIAVIDSEELRNCVISCPSALPPPQPLLRWLD